MRDEFTVRRTMMRAMAASRQHKAINPQLIANWVFISMKLFTVDNHVDGAICSAIVVRLSRCRCRCRWLVLLLLLVILFRFRNFQKRDRVYLRDTPSVKFTKWIGTNFKASRESMCQEKKRATRYECLLGCLFVWFVCIYDWQWQQ